MTQSVLERAQAGISAWQIAVNNQDAAGCAAQYAEDAVMIAKPFGTFEPFTASLQRFLILPVAAMECSHLLSGLNNETGEFLFVFFKFTLEK